MPTKANPPQLETSPLPFLHLMQVLKHLPRTGWLRTVEHPESVASHSFRLALLGAFAPQGLDRTKCILIGLCHDLAESVVGDIPTFAGVSKERKHKLEYFGFRYIVELVKPCHPALADDLLACWLDYEDGRTPEGRWMREMDKFECLIQAHEYEQRTYGRADLGEFQGLSSKISSHEGRAWLELLQQERSEHFLKRERRLPVIFIAGDSTAAETHCATLSEELGLQHTTLDAIVHEKSEEQAYRHSDFVRDCLKEGVDVPIDLVISLLEEKIEGMNGGDRGWSLVCGFPASLGQLLEFERKVQAPNYVVLLSSSGEGQGSKGQHWGDIGERNAALEHHLKSTGEHYKEINCDRSEDETYRLLKGAVEEFIEHTKGGK